MSLGSSVDLFQAHPTHSPHCPPCLLLVSPIYSIFSFYSHQYVSRHARRLFQVRHIREVQGAKAYRQGLRARSAFKSPHQAQPLPKIEEYPQRAIGRIESSVLPAVLHFLHRSFCPRAFPPDKPVVSKARPSAHRRSSLESRSPPARLACPAAKFVRFRGRAPSHLFSVPPAPSPGLVQQLRELPRQQFLRQVTRRGSIAPSPTTPPRRVSLSFWTTAWTTAWTRYFFIYLIRQSFQIVVHLSLKAHVSLPLIHTDGLPGITEQVPSRRCQAS
jgi:hypothetical protein